MARGDEIAALLESRVFGKFPSERGEGSEVTQKPGTVFRARRTIFATRRENHELENQGTGETHPGYKGRTEDGM